MENTEDDSQEPENRFTELPEGVLKRVKKVLLPGEEIEFSLRAIVGSHSEGSSVGVQTGKIFNVGMSSPGPGTQQIGHPWFVITNQRLMLVSKGIISFEMRQFRFDQISAVEIQQGLIEDKLIVSGMGIGEVWVFRRRVRGITLKAVQYLQSKIGPGQQTASRSPSSQADPLNELKLRLARGEISTDEYNRLKDVLSK